MNRQLQEYLDSPITSADRASRIWLPEGKPPPRKRDEGELAAGMANAQMGRVRHRQELASKHAQLFDYYAQTTVPLERVAEHMGIKDMSLVRAEMKKRGRSA